MKTNETSTHEKHLIWWNNLPSIGIPSKEYYMGLYYSDDTVTDDKIKRIWEQQVEKLHQIRKIYEGYEKPNQKQFKQFDESLFQAYISKFSDEDKYEMLRVIAESFKLNFEFNNSFTSIWNNSLE
jgi:hypothetical protein